MPSSTTRQRRDHVAFDPTLGLDAQKKSLRASEQDPVSRAAFQARLQTRPAEDFVIIDECGSNLNLTPRYARAPRGARAYGAVPRNTPPNTTVIASLSLQGIGPSVLMPGRTDGLAFEAYIEQVLAPTLRPGQVVVLDNLSVHHSARVAQLIRARDCELWFLPSYSPDLSPIEQAFAKFKQTLRRAGARTLEALYEAISQALPTISAQDALGFFLACGYPAPNARASSLCIPL